MMRASGVRHVPRAIALWLMLAGAATSVAVPAHLFVVTSDPNGGSADALDLTPPWTADLNVEPAGRDVTVRHFYGLHYVIDRQAATIQVIDAATLDTVRTLSIDAGSIPHDILVVSPGRAYVTRYAGTELYEIDPVSGALNDSIDLSGLADADGLPEMSMMALDGNHLFVQIQRVDWAVSGSPVRPSYLAVIDIRTNELIDVDPDTAGPQGIALQGPIPSFPMHVDSVRRRLVVSTPGPRLDVSGGIEEVDLDTMQSLGFIYSEDRAGIDLGGFVMTGPDSGYVIGHTDIVASSHLKYFDRDPGAPGQIEIHTSLFVHNDRLAYDPMTQLLYYPDATASPPGIHVFDAVSNTRLTTTPVATSKPPIDLVVARDATPGEADFLKVTGYDPLSGSIAFTYGQACGATNHNVVFGPLASFGNYAYAGQACGIGASGNVPAFAPGPGSFFFMVIGSDGSGRTGSYGLSSDDAERPAAPFEPLCPFVQDLSSRCDP